MSYSAEVDTAKVDYSLVGTLLRLASEIISLLDTVTSSLLGPLTFTASESINILGITVKQTSKGMQETQLFLDSSSKSLAFSKLESYVSQDSLVKGGSVLRTETLSFPEVVRKQIVSFLFTSHLSQDTVFKNSILQRLESTTLLEIPKKLITTLVLAGNVFQDTVSKLITFLKPESCMSQDTLVKTGSILRPEVFSASGTVTKQTASFLLASHISQDLVYKVTASLKNETAILSEVSIKSFASFKQEALTSLEAISKISAVVKRESSTFIDTIVKAISISVKEILATSDYFIRIWQIFLTPLETPKFVESLAKRIQGFRFESVVLAFFFYSTSSYLRTLFGSHFLIDVLSKEFSSLRTGSLTIVDYISAMKAFLRAMFEGMILSSYSTIIASLLRGELITTSELLFKQFILLKGELQVLVDSLKNFVASVKKELYQLQDSTFKLASLLKTEIVTLSDYFLRLWQVFLSAAESLKLSDIASRVQQFLLQQMFTLSSVIYSVSSFLRSLGESSLFTEEVQKQTQALRRDVLLLVDVLSRISGTLLILFELTTLSAITRSLFVSIRSELASYAEAIVKQMNALRTELSVFSDFAIHLASTLKTQMVTFVDSVFKESIASRFESLVFAVTNVFYVSLSLFQMIYLTEESRKNLYHILTSEIVVLVDVLTSWISSLLREVFFVVPALIKSFKTALVGKVSLLELLLKEASTRSSELINFYDSRVTEIVKVCIETNVLVDLFLRVVNYVRLFISTMSLLESIIPTVGVLFWYFESINLSEQVSRQVSFSRVFAEILSTVEERATYFPRTLVQSLSLFGQTLVNTGKHVVQGIHLEEILSKSCHFLLEARLVLTGWLSSWSTFLLSELFVPFDSVSKAISSLRAEINIFSDSVRKYFSRTLFVSTAILDNYSSGMLKQVTETLLIIGLRIQKIFSLLTETFSLSPLAFFSFVRLMHESVFLADTFAKKVVKFFVEVFSLRDYWFKQWLSSRVLLESLIVRELTRSVMKKVLREIVVYLELLSAQFTFMRVYTYAVKLPLSIYKKIYITLKQKYSTRLKENSGT